MIRGRQTEFVISKSNMFNGWFAKPDMDFREDINKSQKRMKKLIKDEKDPGKVSRLKVIRKEMKLLRLQLDNL